MPDDVQAIFSKMVAKKAEDRYQSMTAVIADLERAIAGQSSPSNLAPPASASDTGLTNFFQNQIPASTKKPKPAKPLLREPAGSAPAPQKAQPQAPPLRFHRRRRARPPRHPARALLRPERRRQTRSQIPFGNRATAGRASSGPGGTAGHALDFDGRQSYVATPIMYDGSHPITLEAYVTPRLKWNQPACRFEYAEAGGISLKPNQQRMAPSGRTRWQSDPPRVTRQNHRPAHPRMHLAGVWDGQRLSLFVDGVFTDFGCRTNCTRRRTARWRSAQSNRQVLPQAPRNQFFSGIIDEVRISKTARYTANFTPKPRHEPDADTLGLYHFDEGTGDIAYDASPNKNHARIFGAKWTPRRHFGLGDCCATGG